MASTTRAELLKTITEAVTAAMQPPFAAISAQMSTLQLELDEVKAQLAQSNERLKALAPGEAKRVLKTGVIADAPAAPAARGKKATATAAPAAAKAPSNAMHLFTNQFSTMPEVRAATKPEAVALARTACKLGEHGDLDEKSWKKVASALWKVMDTAQKGEWSAKLKAMQAAAIPEELGLDAGEGYDEVDLDA